MEKAVKYGQMEVFMKATGKTDSQMVEVDLFMLMEIFMKVIGKMIWHTVLESIHTQTEQNMRVNG